MSSYFIDYKQLFKSSEATILIAFITLACKFYPVIPALILHLVAEL